jgi:Ala-tRNA(Pro) deacylase
MPATESELFDRFAALGIATETVRHAPVFTVDESKQLRGELSGGHTKNLFLKDKKDILWLVITHEDVIINLKILRNQIGAAALSFASPATLRQVLGVEPGSVTPFALINDTGQRVRVVIDGGLLSFERLYFHPLVNSASTAISPQDLLTFLRACGHEPSIVEFSKTVHGMAECAGAAVA